ncbi:biotin-dependent carboxyltransferase family protein [Jatrophihabitans fulvus]
MTVEIVRPGPFASVQDGGRVGWAHLGVPRSGAFDRRAHRQANRLVGNAPDAPVIEVLLGGLAFRTDSALTVAVTGAPCPGLVAGTAVTLRAGDQVALGTPGHGARTYLAARGGFAADAVLGSVATDVLSGLGRPPLAAGDRLGIGAATVAAVTDAVIATRPGDGTLPVRLGPRDDRLNATSRAALTRTVWTVRDASDRIGVRLDGPPLERIGGELPSEPTLPGAVQVPGDGRPIVFGPDAPVTGGYPVVAVVTDLGTVAQLRPGDRVRFSARG